MKALADRLRAALGPTPLPDVVPTPALLEKLAAAFAAASADVYGIPLDFTPASLDRIIRLLPVVGSSDDRVIVLGAGAYYGETLRKAAGATWRLRAVPFGTWVSRPRTAFNAFVDPVLPFSEVYRDALGSNLDRILDSNTLAQRDPGQALLLIYPPADVDAAVEAATPDAYRKARQRLDAGEVKPALDLLAGELKRRPKSRMLAREVIGLCETAGLPDTARDLTTAAVRAGNTVPELLLRQADTLAATDPKAALPLLRQAVQDPVPPPGAYLKLGNAYDAVGKRALAEACWRRAYPQATDADRRHIRDLLGLPPLALRPTIPDDGLPPD
jgi:hypothetical protein